MTYHFKCILCGEEYEAGQVRYVCPKHGDDGILDTILDYKKIATTTSPKKISDSRDYSIWRYSDLLPLDNPRNPHRRFTSVGRRSITRPKQASSLV